MTWTHRMAVALCSLAAGIAVSAMSCAKSTPTPTAQPAAMTQEQKVEGLAPLPLRISHDRVSEEGAEVRFLIPDHPVLNVPNKITAADFEGWVQERGLYFADQWDPAFQAVLSCNDAGEPPRDGGLLVAQVGKGNFVYTGYSWFRQIPAGVPGSYRLFANLIALGH